VSQKSSAGYEAWSEELYADWMAAENNTAAVTKSYLRVKGRYLDVLKSHRGLHEKFVALQTKHSQLAADFQALQSQSKGSKSLTEQHVVPDDVYTGYRQQQEVRSCLNYLYKSALWLLRVTLTAVWQI